MIDNHQQGVMVMLLKFNDYYKHPF